MPGNKFESLHKSPIVFIVLLNTFLRCSSNVNLTSKITPKMFLRVNLGNIFIVEKQRRMCRLFSFSAEYDFLSLLPTIWIEIHFPFFRGPNIGFLRSLFSSIADVFISCTMKIEKHHQQIV